MDIQKYKPSVTNPVDAITDIVKSNALTLAALDYDVTEKELLIAISAFMVAYSPYPESTNILAMRNFVKQLVSMYPSWKVADVSNFLQWFVASQHLEEVKVLGNKITYLKLSSVLPMYEDYRVEAVKSINHAKAYPLIGDANRSELSQDAKSIINEIKNRVKPKYVARPFTDEELAEQKITSDILNEFEKLWHEQGQKTHGAFRYVIVNDITYYIVDWERERKFGALKKYKPKKNI